MYFQSSHEALAASRWREAIESLVRLAVEIPSLFPSVALEVDRILRRYADPSAHFAFSRGGLSAKTRRWLHKAGWSFDEQLFRPDPGWYGDTVVEALVQEARREQSAASWAFSRARGAEIEALDLLLARHYKAEPQIWLRQLNRYLTHSGASLALPSSTEIARFHSLAVQGNWPTVDAGPLVSVIMPVHNAQATLRQAAQSILDQTWRPLELILVDDASTDGSGTICAELCAVDPRVKVHRQPINVGPYVCRNVGLHLATGRYVTCHDADDLALPFRIEHQVGLLASNPDGARLTSSRMIRLAEDGEPSRPSRIGPYSDDGFSRKCFVSLMFERTHFDTHLGAWDNVRVGADAELIERAYQIPGGILEDDRIVMLCLDNEHGLTRDPVLGMANLESDGPRAAYQRTWRRSHGVRGSALRQPTFPGSRPFEAPKQIEVPEHALKKVYARIQVTREEASFPAPLPSPDELLDQWLPRLVAEGKHPRQNAPEHALFEANELVAHVGHEAAILYAERHLPAKLRPALNILRANAALERHDESTWLDHLNRYLKTFRIAPVRLRHGNHLLSRLSTDPLPAVTHGSVVSVIMPAWNAEATVEEAANSILAQTWRPLELIIVDDASTDGTWEALRRLRNRDPRVRILRNRCNVGPYVSKNIALMSAKGEFVTGHDSDDWAHPQRIEHHVSSLLASAGAIRASVAYMLRLTPEGKFSFITRTNDFSFDGAARKALISCMFRREDLERRLGFWDTVRFAADSEMMSRAQSVFGESFQNFASVGMLCLDHADGLTNDPLHGVRAVNGGLSDSRKAYRDSWLSVHRAGLTPGQAFLEFPQRTRRYVPVQGVAVSYEDQLANLPVAGEVA